MLESIRESIKERKFMLMFVININANTYVAKQLPLFYKFNKRVNCK